MQYLKIISLLTFIFIITACGLSPFDETTNSTIPVSGNMREENTLFETGADNCVFMFETNDTKYLGANGYTIWSVPYINTSDTFDEFTVETVKENGRTEAGFGIIFCAQQINEKPFMLTVMINANGFYTVGKITNGVYCHINEGWRNCRYIRKGLGVKNRLCISYDNERQNYILKINGYEITEFTVSENITFKNSRKGFAVVIANNENFPSSSVKVTFEYK